MNVSIHSTFRVLYFLLALSIAAGGVYFFWQSQRAPSFPYLQSAAFTGSISGLNTGFSEASNKEVSLYVEKIARRNALLFVPFVENAKPLVIPLRPLQDSGKGSKLYEPIEISIEETTFTLSGQGQEGSYSGKVYSGKKHIGHWSLEKAQNEELRRDLSGSFGKFSLEKWLKLKARNRAVTEEHQILVQDIAAKTKHYEKLLEITSNDEAFKLRTANHKAELETEIENLSAKLDKEKSEVDRLVRELEQLDRITRRGRAIELARRVSKRENKWYMVNWQQEADLSSVEDSIAQKMNVDLVKLREQVRRATEVRALNASISREKARLKELEQIYQMKIREGSSTRPTTRPSRAQGEKPWWDVFN